MRNPVVWRGVQRLEQLRESTRANAAAKLAEPDVIWCDIEITTAEAHAEHLYQHYRDALQRAWTERQQIEAVRESWEGYPTDRESSFQRGVRAEAGFALSRPRRLCVICGDVIPNDPATGRPHGKTCGKGRCRTKLSRNKTSATL